MVENGNDWFGNFIMNYIQLILGYYVAYFGAWLALFGMPTWGLETITSFALMPPEFTSWKVQFN